MGFFRDDDLARRARFEALEAELADARERLRKAETDRADLDVLRRRIHVLEARARRAGAGDAISPWRRPPLLLAASAFVGIGAVLAIVVGGRGSSVPTPTAIPPARESTARARSPSGSAAALPSAFVSAVIASRTLEIRRCYERALASDPELAGTVRMSLTIAADGRAEEVHAVSSTLRDPAVGECVRAELSSLSFARRPGGASVT